nr:unnamed protein product [Callosobruchus chinensis]
MGKTIEVTIADGTLKGKQGKDYRDGNYYSFLGIPYAKPPIGERRFKAPEPVEPWKGVKDATQRGAECPQYMIVTFGKEDNCLNLNVFTKELGQGLKKPVMVFIHGGGLVSGSNRPDILYGPQFLITEDIVLVTVNYRLGLLGFLSLEDRSLNVPGNAGMKDQVMALRWVQRNIKYFGGDPDNVTIFGESAGSASVHFLVSGCVLNPWATSKPNAAEVAKAMGFRSDADESYILKEMKNASAATIMKGQKKFQFVPMIMGYNSLEGLFFEMLGRLSTMQHHRLPMSLESDVPHNCDVDASDAKLVGKVANDIKRFYYKDEKISKANKHIRYLLHKKTGSKPIYAYRMGIESNLNLCKLFAQTKSPRMFSFLMGLSFLTGSAGLAKVATKMKTDDLPGVCHADDLFYLFKSFHIGQIRKDSEQDKWIQRFVKLWTNFAKTGADPVLEGAVWKPVGTKEIDNIFNIDHGLRCGGLDAKEKERMAFWDKIGPVNMTEPLVTVEQGVLRGCVKTSLNDEEFLSFQGIPYAKPPVGQLRFKVSAKKLKPVMVYIHGGGYVTGSSKAAIYGPEYLMMEDIVLVTLNYRLGLLGFLSLNDSSLGVPGNAGLKDMVMALKWVQRNIKQFSGDPNNVTIFGESLFHKAIAQSGCATNGWAVSKRHGAHLLAEALGIHSTNEKVILEELQQVSAEELYEGCDKVWDTTTLEPTFISEHPLKILKSGKYNQVPMIVGSCSREGMFVYAMCTANMKKNHLLSDETLVPASLSLRKGTGRYKEVVYTDNFFLYEIYRCTKLHLETNNYPIYFYRFSMETELNFMKILYGYTEKGACHADEFSYLFKNSGTVEVTDKNSQEMLGILRMVRMWTNFAKSANPTPNRNDPILPIEWKPISKQRFHVLDIDDELKLLDDHPEKEAMDFWDMLHQRYSLTSKL